jgi:hypothetical protein
MPEAHYFIVPSLKWYTLPQFSHSQLFNCTVYWQSSQSTDLWSFTNDPFAVWWKGFRSIAQSLKHCITEAWYSMQHLFEQDMKMVPVFWEDTFLWWLYVESGNLVSKWLSKVKASSVLPSTALSIANCLIISYHHIIFILFQRSTFGGTALRYRTRQLHCTFELHILINCLKLSI